MKEKIIKYKVKNEANTLNKIIASEIKRSTFKKENNISGDYSKEGGFDIYNTFSGIYNEISIEPMVKLNLKSVNTDINGNESLLILKRINSESYIMHCGFSIVFFIVTLLISFYIIFSDGIIMGIKALLLPILCLIYFAIIEFYSQNAISNLIRKIEKLLYSKNIKYNKL